MSVTNTVTATVTVTQKETPVAQEYYLGNIYLPRVQEEKDLGVTISCNLS